MAEHQTDVSAASFPTVIGYSLHAEEPRDRLGAISSRPAAAVSPGSGSSADRGQRPWQWPRSHGAVPCRPGSLSGQPSPSRPLARSRQQRRPVLSRFRLAAGTFLAQPRRRLHADRRGRQDDGRGGPRRREPSRAPRSAPGFDQRRDLSRSRHSLRRRSRAGRAAAPPSRSALPRQPRVCRSRTARRKTRRRTKRRVRLGKSALRVPDRQAALFRLQPGRDRPLGQARRLAHAARGEPSLPARTGSGLLQSSRRPPGRTLHQRRGVGRRPGTVSTRRIDGGAPRRGCSCQGLGPAPTDDGGPDRRGGHRGARRLRCQHGFCRPNAHRPLGNPALATAGRAALLDVQGVRREQNQAQEQDQATIHAVENKMQLAQSDRDAARKRAC